MAKVFLRDPSAGLQTLHSSGLLRALGSPILPVRVPGTGEQSLLPLE